MPNRPTLLRLLACLLIVPLLLVGGCGSKASKSASAPHQSAVAGATQGDDNADPTDPVDPDPADAANVADTCPTSNTTSFAKSKFALHAGLGLGAFQHWIYKPYKTGALKKGTKGRFVAFVKAGGAALFVKRELRLTAEDAKASPALCKAIVKPLSDLADKVKGAVDSAKSGNFAALDSLNTDQQSLMSGAAKNGDPIKPDEGADITNLKDNN